MEYIISESELRTYKEEAMHLRAAYARIHQLEQELYVLRCQVDQLKKEEEQLDGDSTD